MNRLNVFSGGQPLRVDDIDFIHSGVLEALKGICLGLSNETNLLVLSGCIATVAEIEEGFSCSITEGYIYFNGEIYFVPAHSIDGIDYDWFVLKPTETYAASGDGRVFKDGTTGRQLHAIRRLALYHEDTISEGAIDVLDLLDATLSEALWWKKENDTWIQPTFNDGWQSGTNWVYFRKNMIGNLEICGNIKHIGAYTNGIAFVLPSLYKPLFDQQIVLQSVEPTGRNSIVMTIGLNGNVSVDLTEESLEADEEFIFNHTIYL